MNGKDKIAGMSGDVELTVLAPMYNEAQNVENTVSMIGNALDRFDRTWELLLVNDGSDDETLKIARDLESKTVNLRVILLVIFIGSCPKAEFGFVKNISLLIHSIITWKSVLVQLGA